MAEYTMSAILAATSLVVMFTIRTSLNFVTMMILIYSPILIILRSAFHISLTLGIIKINEPPVQPMQFVNWMDK